MFFSDQHYITLQLVDSGDHIIAETKVPRTPEWWDLDLENRTAVNKKPITFPEYTGRAVLVAGIGVILDGVPFGGGQMIGRPIVKTNTTCHMLDGQVRIEFLDDTD